MARYHLNQEDFQLFPVQHHLSKVKIVKEFTLKIKKYH